LTTVSIVLAAGSYIGRCDIDAALLTQSTHWQDSESLSVINCSLCINNNFQCLVTLRPTRKIFLTAVAWPYWLARLLSFSDPYCQSMCRSWCADVCAWVGNFDNKYLGN